MLWDASAINGYALEACDGRLGTVSDLLFEDAGGSFDGSSLIRAIGSLIGKSFCRFRPWGNPIGRCATSPSN
jgi:hypothetical protein